MKVAIFSGEIPSSTFIEELIRGIAQSHKVLLFGVVKKNQHYANKNIKIYKTPFTRGLNLIYNSYRSFLLLIKRPKELIKLTKEIKKYKNPYEKWIWYTKFLPIILYKPDILHLQWARDVEFYTFLKEDFGIKIILSLRGAHLNYTPIIDARANREYRLNFPKIDSFHAVSNAIIKVAMNYGAAQKDITVIHSPVNPSSLGLFRHNNIKKPIRILSVGRFHWVKGLRYTFDACKLLQDKNFDYRLDVISTNKISEESLFQIHQLQLEQNVNILNPLGQEELFKLMQEYDVLLLSSLNEGIANVVLEALAIGIIVISTDCGGMSEVVIPGKTGWLVPIRNPEAVANAIIEISECSDTRLNEIRNNAHIMVKNNFDSSKSIEQFIQLYENTLNG
ncbi:colanic acid/amylovoran biosynthesis glycosyltransferase [Flavobacteriaceae bacterium MAR_2010_188]|nr:colanic acid/amylovoran biosynthesis glycosyltransferase [Flavobacteriaceae bacterium MAR_2010_188]